MLENDFWKMMRPYRSWAMLLMAGAAASCATAPPEATQPTAEQPAVVATSTVLCDLVEQIAEDSVALTCLMQPGQDPHVYEPTPSDRQAIEQADLVFYGGYGYEPDLIAIINATNTPAPKLAVYELAVPAPLKGLPHDHGAEHGAEGHDHAEGGVDDHDHDHAHEETSSTEAEEHSHDDAVHGESAEAAHDHGSETELAADPHVWHNANHGVQMVRVIEQQLGAIAPDQRDRYGENAEAIAQELQAIDGWIIEQAATVPASARKLVTTHNSFAYYADAYGFTVAGALSGLSTEARPSAARLVELVDLVKDANVPAIFSEATSNKQLIQTVAREAGVAVAEQELFVEGPSGSESPAPTYQQMLITNTCTIVNALGGQCDPTTAPGSAS